MINPSPFTFMLNKFVIILILGSISQSFFILNDDSTHTVLVELGSLTTCPYCPAGIEALQELYEEQEIPFYYMTLVYDKSDVAMQRGRWLNDVYVPMLYVDGGYLVVDEATKEAYYDAIEKASKREVNDIDMNISAEWIGNDIKITLYIHNEDSSPHFEHVKICILEKVSRWKDAKGENIRYALMDYAFNGYLILKPRERKIEIKWNNDMDLKEGNTVVLAYASQATPKLQKNPWDDPWWSSYFIAQFVDEACAVEI